MTAVSIIVPIYNAEKSLDRCLASLLAQTLQNCEFIIINDGSADSSLQIMEAFKREDPRFVLINQQNQGVSAARNAGLKSAKGKYIGFADADDTVSNDYFQSMYELATEENLDIVISHYALHQKNEVKTIVSGFRENAVLDVQYIKKEVMPSLIQSEKLNAVWNKIYRRELLVNNQVTFPVGKALGEDGWFNLQAFHKAGRVYFALFSGYHYHETAGSATRDFLDKDYFQPIVADFSEEYSVFENPFLDAERIHQFKAQKFLQKSISLLNEYANPQHHLGFKKAYAKIAEVVYHPVFMAVTDKHHNQWRASKSRYERFLLWAAKNKWVSLLLLAAAYSRFRNK